MNDLEPALSQFGNGVGSNTFFRIFDPRSVVRELR